MDLLNLKDDCIFCRIIKGELPSAKVYEDDMVLVFEDNHPVAPIHWLVIPKVHIASVGEITKENSHIAAHMMEVIGEVAKEKGVKEFRLVSNCGPSAGQTVEHLHIHLLSGRKLDIMG